ncbi:hypothetical protein Bequi_09830 [Brachybacterium sp. JHP9]|uniref:Uncharacterized protein n=1 Tax=Brachybacterium equifaecis TaxID=2910770 RepID=A0ABT0R182_9MICO|nr:hypothetical protein [Brachybacterium equifaecis]MCL6423682.1 hypothetical protein [Brachybacterium equifaecis]
MTDHRTIRALATVRCAAERAWKGPDDRERARRWIGLTLAVLDPWAAMADAKDAIRRLARRRRAIPDAPVFTKAEQE